VAASVGAKPPLFTHVVAGQVIVEAVPSSIIRVKLSPAAKLSVGVEAPDNVQV
jgi:hypothetical protein